LDAVRQASNIDLCRELGEGAHSIMAGVIKSLILAIAQLADPAIRRVMVKSLLITLVGFVGLGVALAFGLDAAFSYLGLDQDAFASAALAALIALLAFWLLFRIVAVAVIQFFAEEIVVAVERRHYPDALDSRARARGSPGGAFHKLAGALRSAGLALSLNLLALPIALVLLFTAIGPAVVFIAVNAILLGRELVEIAEEHRGVNASAEPRPGRWQQFALGLAVAAIMAVPFVNLLAPVVGAAAATHMVHTARGRILGDG